MKTPHPFDPTKPLLSYCVHPVAPAPEVVPALRQLRRDLGLTQREMATLLGTHSQTISDTERGVSSLPRHAARLVPPLQRFALTAADCRPAFALTLRREGSLAALAVALGTWWAACSVPGRSRGEVIP